jgi:hypothetical protein
VVFRPVPSHALADIHVKQGRRVSAAIWIGRLLILIVARYRRDRDSLLQGRVVAALGPVAFLTSADIAPESCSGTAVCRAPFDARSRQAANHRRFVYQEPRVESAKLG